MMVFRPAAVALPIALLVATPVAADPVVSERLDRIEQRLVRQEDNQVLLEMLRRLESLEREVRELRGETETGRHQIDEIRERQRNLYLDIDRRLQTAEAAAAAAPVAPVAPQIAAPVGVAPATPVAPQIPGPAVPAKPAVPAPPAAAVRPATPAAQPASAPTAEESGAYRQAFDLLQNGRNAEAAAAFTRYLEDHPGGGYAANAQYWLGEARYVAREYDAALEEFRKVIDQYPQSNKAPDALLKIGFTHYELGEHEEARKTLTETRNRYPGSTVARLADQRLRRMGEEGR